MLYEKTEIVGGEGLIIDMLKFPLSTNDPVVSNRGAAGQSFI